MGVCMIPVVDENGKEGNKGIRLDLFFYSGKNIISQTVYNAKKQSTFQCIASMPDNIARAKGWMGQIKRSKKNKDVYMQDKLLAYIPGIAAQIESRLETATLTLTLALMNIKFVSSSYQV